MPIAVVLEPPLTLFFLQLFHTFYSRCWCVRGFYSVLSLVYNSSETRGTWIFSWHDKLELETVLRSNGLRTSLFVFGFIVDWVRALHTQAWAQHRGLYVSWSWLLTLCHTLTSNNNNDTTGHQPHQSLHLGVTKQVAARNNIQDDFGEPELKFKCKLLH